ncbi:TIGR01841 family phasin [Erythrobacter arachoides]|uniref:TIGR01841 family phasin n=1 Tax=Aurantiacibacter arachoides TaxID=1850444 RepID=A0A845A3W0_9SPHN|nr:phasin family protein [Aurantiacibacter arachoides]MXO92289.1 TIGR01841 family phasin [Aurantiacibacter arachoides]
MASKPDYSNDYTSAMTDSMSGAVTEMQSRAQAAYEKGTANLSDMTDFAKGNVEAMVESTKVMAEGMQALGKTYAEEAKSAYETITADLKEMAAVKSPTELFQLQGRMMRRNFDAMMAVGTRNTDAAVKLANDVAAPLSGRVNIAAEKMSKVA